MTFYTYMIRNYLLRSHPEGTLAIYIKWDSKKFPRNTNGKIKGWDVIIRDYLVRNGASDACIDTFNKCWNEYVEYIRKMRKRAV